MIRLLHLEIHDTCDNCPYFRFQDVYADDIYYCSNPDSIKYTEDTIHGRIYDKIPEWCPLLEYIEGGKF